MYKIKCINRGINSRGKTFRPNNFYNVTDEDAEYLTKTFPNIFIKIEKIKVTSKKTSRKSKPAEVKQSIPTPEIDSSAAE